MTIQHQASRDPWWLRVLSATLKVVIAAQVTFLLVVGGVVLSMGVGIIGLAMSR